MPSDRDRTHSRVLLAAALLVALLATVWAMHTPVGPDSDRYDYLGRAHHLLQNEGPRPLVVYPLRFAFEGADALPPRNLTRPPLWPVLLAPGLRWGAEEIAGVITAALALFTLIPMIAMAGNRAFGRAAGSFAALAVATSFATTRALWGGGPEVWIALLVAFVWTWNPPDRPWTAGAILGAALALMPWLHPIGWVYAGLAWLARIGRTAPRALALAAGLTVLLGSPWYLQVGAVTGSFFAPLQGHAEVAKALHDAGGLGPYRTLEPIASLDVVRADPGAWLYHAAWNLKEQALGLDGWLAWTLVPLAVIGIRRDPRLALRDAGLGFLAFVAVSAVANDPRLLVPALPIAATWAGAGYGVLCAARPAWFGPPVALILAVAPWVLPLGRTPLPGTATEDVDAALTDPPPDLVLAVAQAPGPLIVDNAVLAWRARRPAVFIPDGPSTLEALRAKPALQGSGTLVLQRGASSPWIDPSWSAWIAARPKDTVHDAWLVALDAPRDTTYVPDALALGADDVPDSLITLDVPPASRAGIRITAATARALNRMLAAARADGVDLRIVSGYRSYVRQRTLYESAIARHGDDQRWVAAPGTSEHQLGTTMDFADAALKHAVEPSFAGTDEGRWLAANARRFGFVRSYTAANEERTGYRPEPWHYRYRPALFPPGDTR